jgi:hypothetical protein
MFGSVISRKIDVAIVLLDADGKEFEEPDSFQKNASNDAYYMLQRIGWSHQNFESNRNVFESVHLQAYFNKNLRYRLIRRSFDTIEFYRSGTFQSDVIGEYKATKND